MYTLTIKRDKIRILMKTIPIGNDLCVLISGGESPHIGCVTLSVPRDSLSDTGIKSATTSVLNLLGHKDEDVARYVSHTLSARLYKNVVATCGIHIDNITTEEIETVMDITRELTERIIEDFQIDVRANLQNL